MNQHLYPTPPPLVVTIAEACELTRLGRSTIYQLIRSGQLETVKFGRSRRVKYAALEALVARSPVELEDSP